MVRFGAVYPYACGSLIAGFGILVGFEARSIGDTAQHDYPKAAKQIKQYALSHHIADNCLRFLRSHDDFMASINTTDATTGEAAPQDCTGVEIHDFRGVMPLLDREKSTRRDAQLAPMVEVGSATYVLIGAAAAIGLSWSRRTDQNEPVADSHMPEQDQTNA